MHSRKLSIREFHKYFGDTSQHFKGSCLIFHGELNGINCKGFGYNKTMVLTLLIQFYMHVSRAWAHFFVFKNNFWP